MKITNAKRRVLLTMWKTQNMSRQDQDRALFKADPNSVCYCSLQDHGMVCPPGILTPKGRALAQELAALETTNPQTARPKERGMRLTEKRIQALQDIANKKVEYHRFGYGAWRITGPSQPTVVGTLIQNGFAQWIEFPVTNDAKFAQLTDKGRTALEATNP